MLERRRIVELARTGTAEVLITLVRAAGSSYRRPGARILLAAGNAYAGTISGGCLEAEVTRKAAWLVRHGAVIERYSTLFDDTAEIPYGLGCGGTVDLLFEPAGTPEAEALLRALEASLVGVESRVQTYLPSATQPLCRVVYSASGEVLFASRSFSGDPAAAVYREHVEAPQRLVLLGAGDDAKPVVRMAALLGWNVLVADGRAQLARWERFSEAQAVSTVPVPRECARKLSIASSDAIVLMTHSYEQDRDCLASILSVAPQRYLGILGARHRTALLVAEAAALTSQSVAACCERIHAPVGLDLGGDGPEAIALAIVAEVQASIQGKLAASRSLTAEEVKSQLSQNRINYYKPVQCVATETASR